MMTEGQTPLDVQESADVLLVAIEAGDASAVRKLIERGANPNSCWTGEVSTVVTEFMRKRQLHCDEIGFPALIVAVLEGSGEIVRLLLEAGAAMNGKLRFDSWALDALECACWRLAENPASVDRDSIARMLVQHGIDTRSNALTMVPESCGGLVEFLLGYPQKPDALLKMLCKVSEYSDQNSRDDGTALRIAGRLLDLGVDANAELGDATPLINAISNHRRPGLASYLIDRGADPMKENKRSPLTQALRCGFDGSVRLLLSHGIIPEPMHLSEALTRLGSLKDDDILAVMEGLHQTGIDPREIDLSEKLNVKSLLLHLLRTDCEKSARYLFEVLGEDLYQKTKGGAPLARVCGPKAKQMLLSLKTADIVVEGVGGCAAPASSSKFPDAGAL